jgi:hypothetical protein
MKSSEKLSPIQIECLGRASALNRCVKIADVTAEFCAEPEFPSPSGEHYVVTETVPYDV